MYYNMKILERRRMEKGLSYTDIAHKVGIDKNTVARALKGLTQRPGTVKKLADFLSVDLATIVEG